MKKVLIPGLITGVALFVVGMLVSMLFNMLIPSLIAEYKNPALFRPWSDPLMQLYFAYPFILGFAYAWVWDKIKGVIGGSPLKFMIGILVISTLPGMFVTYSSFQVTKYMVLSWSVMGLVNAYVAGLILAKMNK